ncbi:DUF460 domain-containing protein [Candidatus Woesearchaeota archaeon]|nr:MAG: DUF460 domain-containing protein [Candidatus Woesearchaeota archaeon]
MILGLDPGTTLGWALVDFSGNIISKGSERGADLSSILFRILQHGRVFFVATDKAKVPGLVESAARMLGVQAVSPKEDLLVREKRGIVEGIKCANSHEMDALAAALFALNKKKGIILRVKSAAGNNGVDFEKLLSIVLKSGISIHHAMELLREKPREPEEGKVQNKGVGVRSVLKALLRSERSSIERIAFLEKELKSKKALISDLQERLRGLVRPKSAREKNMELARMLRLSESRLANAKKTIASLKKRAFWLESLALNDELIALQRIERISKESVSKLKPASVIFVDEIKGFSSSAVNELERKGVSFIVCRALPSSKARNIISIPCVSCKRAKVNGNIAVVGKAWLKRARSSRSVLEKVIREYKSNRGGGALQG